MIMKKTTPILSIYRKQIWEMTGRKMKKTGKES